MQNHGQTFILILVSLWRFCNNWFDNNSLRLTPVGNIENLVSSFSADFSHMIDLTDFLIIANESRGMNLAIQ